MAPPDSSCPAAEIAEWEDTLRSMLGSTVVLQVINDPTAPRIGADRAFFRQVLFDLILHAREAVHGGGSITVQVERVKEADAPTPGSGSPGRPLVRVSVEDSGSGVGVASSYLERTFEPSPFNRGSSSESGPGLSSAHETMRRIGGSMTVANRPGNGTRVSLYFPEATGETAHDTTNPDGLDEGFLVLLVDDESSVRGLVRKFLERADYRVIEASTGEEAWETLQDRTGDVDLLFTDVRMPGIDGITLAHRSLAEYPDLRVLLMSGYSEAINGSGQEIEFGLLSKPFGRAEVLGAVREMLGGE